MNERDITAILTGIVPVIQDYVNQTITKAVVAATAQIDSLVQRLVAVESRAPIPGPPGKDADPPPTLEDIVREALQKQKLILPELLAEAAAKIPPPRDGRDGLPGIQGEKGIDGKDALPGRDGKDALDIEDFNVETVDDGRTISFLLKNAEREIKRELKTGVVLDRGVWRAGDFQKGDGVSHEGSFWIAQSDTSSRPGTLNCDWRLAIKRGRDGKNGGDGKPGDRGPQGTPGLNGRNYEHGADYHHGTCHDAGFFGRG